MSPRPNRLPMVLVALACTLPLSVAGEELTMRVETELFADGGEKPAARSLTLFVDGVAWDFLDLPRSSATQGSDRAADAATDMQLAEIVLHDPARDRVIVVDPVRHVKTQVEAIQLERLSISLATWARGADDRLVRWAGGPDFVEGLTEKDESLELVGPRVRYAVAYAEAPTAAAAGTYRRFADTALLLKALLHPGGIPPFPRLALNRRLEAAKAIPAEVTLEIEPRLTPLPGRTNRLRSLHHPHPRLLAADLKRIEDAEAQVAAAEAVTLAAFVARDTSDTNHGRK
jgi:hypothetical protein